MFCNYERISCEILNTALGPDHAKIAISELKLTLRKYGKEFYAKEQARTKKLANSLVAWSIMKQLYQVTITEYTIDFDTFIITKTLCFVQIFDFISLHKASISKKKNCIRLIKINKV